MTRCSPRRAVLALLAAGAFAAALPVFGQQLRRTFPQNALRGTAVVGDQGGLLINGDPAQRSPGLRIRGQNNMLVMWNTIVGVKLVVNYTLDTGGMVQDLWILTDDEADKSPWPKTIAQAEKWKFDPVGQVWTKP